MADFLPKSDAEFSNWLTNFIAGLTAEATVFSLTPDDLADMTATKTGWTTAYTAHLAAQQAAQAARADKDALREQTEDAVRALVRRLRGTFGNTHPSLAALGLPLADDTRSASPIPSTRPVLQIATDRPQEHRINFADSGGGGTPTKKAKPAGVVAVEIWATPPSDPPTAMAPTKDSDFLLLGTDSATPYLAVYDAADAGKKVWYRARWRNIRGQVGPWSDTLAAIVTG